WIALGIGNSKTRGTRMVGARVYQVGDRGFAFLLLALMCMSLMLGLRAAHAQEAAPPSPAPTAEAPAADAAPVPEAATPATSAAAAPAPVLPAHAAALQLNGGDTAWMLTSTALVLLMTIPGLALFYGGLVRKKNILAT